MSYNGWKNYETWNFMLWLNNEEGSYNSYRKFARSKDFEVTPEEAEQFVKNYFPEGTPDLEYGSFKWSDVDWDAIADSFNEE